MSISPQKNKFIQYIAGGLSTLMNCSMLADEIYASPDDGLEKYIKDNLLVGSSLCEDRFCEAMETIEDRTLKELLEYFDDRDMDISRAYIESGLVPNDLPENLRKFAESIDYREVQTFAEFLEL